LILLAALSAALAAPAFEPRDCPEPIAGQASCGIVRVPEDRSLAGGRTIALNVVVMRATGIRRLPTLFDLEGGPGLPSTKNAGFYLTDGAAYRTGRDIVLFDQRGTGASNPLNCPDLASPADQYEPLYPAERVAACRARLAAGANLDLYGTDIAAADLDAVRHALGARQIDIVALSYGTTLALRYMTLYPGRARAAVLFAAVPPAARPPSGHAPAAQSALDALFASCVAEPACAAAFPDPTGDLRRALERLPALLPREIFLEKIRGMMYAPLSARALPLILHRAASGDFEPFYARTRRSAANPASDGVYLSITCSESLAAIDYEASAAAARATIFGDYRLRRQREACGAWPSPPTAAGFFDHPAPSASVLIVSGSLDPVSPPGWADSIASTARRVRHVVLPGSGHVMDGMSGIDTCLDPLVIGFLDRADPEAIDAGCVAAMRPPPFEVALPVP